MTQGEVTLTPTAESYTQVNRIAAEGAPSFTERSVFRIDADDFSPDDRTRFDGLVQAHFGELLGSAEGFLFRQDGGMCSDTSAQEAADGFRASDAQACRPFLAD